MIRSISVAAAVIAFLAIACGGKAIVDDPLGAGGGGGSSGGNGSKLCAVAAPVGSLTDCDGSTESTGSVTVSTGSDTVSSTGGAVTSTGGDTVSSTGGGASCISSQCDAAGNNYTSDCTDQGCRCNYNGELACICVFDGAATCSQLGSCCPSPFTR
ncbi:MAG: hypothetical protein EXR75_15155 [Myxococcales bacterium]|nr:hypothetical protein [Myxococcales bacterium]